MSSRRVQKHGDVCACRRAALSIERIQDMYWCAGIDAGCRVAATPSPSTLPFCPCPSASLCLAAQVQCSPLTCSLTIVALTLTFARLAVAPRSSHRRQRSQRSHPFALHRRWHEPLTAFRAIPTLDPSSCPLRAFMTIRSTRLFLTKSTSIRINTRIIPSSISPRSTPGTHTTPTPTPTPTHLEPIPTHTLSHRRTCRPKATPTHRHHPRAVPSPVSPRGNRPTSRCIGNCSFRMTLPTGPCRRSSLVPGQTSSRSTRGEQGD